MKRNLKIKTMIMGLLLTVTTVPISSATAQTSTSCSTLIEETFLQAYSGKVKATRITARGTSGFSSFAMAENYSSSNGISTDISSQKEGFIVTPRSNMFEGKFQDVFPGRKDGKTDLTTLRINRNGTVQLVLNAWGNTVVNLRNLQCYRRLQDNTWVLTGTNSQFDFWTFLITPNRLI